MIEFLDATFHHVAADGPVWSDVSLQIPEGELCLVVGVTGSGKSTLLQAINGLVPHFTGGTLTGRVVVAGRDTRTHRPRDLADVVGMVGQDPVAGFVTDHVEDELAYSMESLALPPAVMRKRVEETLDLLGLAELRDRPLSTLSGGQQQRVAIGAALTVNPQVLVLDEPTSALDPTAAEEVLSAVHRLVHDVGITVVLAEHRLERVVQYADRVVWLPGGGQPPSCGPVGATLAPTPVAPPVVALSRAVGWAPPAVSIRDARRRAAPLRAQLTECDPARTAASAAVFAPGAVCLDVAKLRVRHGAVEAVRDVTLSVRESERIAVLGRNGAGKSSLLWAVQGTGRRRGGSVLVNGADPATLAPADRRRRIGLLPQQPSDLLYLETVAEECRQADRESAADSGSCRALLDRLVPGVPALAHPADLSEGQRLALALAIVLTAQPAVLLLDEPTRGLDYPSKTRLAELLRELADTGCATLVSTHDVEFVAEYATRAMVLADGELIADGPTAEIVLASPSYAPQLAKVFAPHPLLTLADVERAGILSEVPV